MGVGECEGGRGAGNEAVALAEEAAIFVTERLVFALRCDQDSARGRVDHSVPTTARQMSAREMVPTSFPLSTTGRRRIWRSTSTVAIFAT